MKDDDEVVRVEMKVVDEDGEWLIFSCLRGFEDEQTFVIIEETFKLFFKSLISPKKESISRNK